MHIFWRFEPQRFLQAELSAGGIKHVGTAHHLCNALKIIINHDGQLVGIQTIGTVDNKVAYAAGG